MTWVKLDDNVFDNPKIVDVSPMARLLHIAGICYSARHLTDGVIARRVVARVHLQAGSDPEHVDELVAARLWHEDKDGWVINDYLEYNPSRERVLGERAAAKERKDRWRERVAERVPNASRNASGTPFGTLPRPDPTRKQNPPSLRVVDNHREHFLPGSGWIREVGS